MLVKKKRACVVSFWSCPAPGGEGGAGGGTVVGIQIRHKKEKKHNLNKKAAINLQYNSFTHLFYNPFKKP
jgi:hypothetical protein